MICSPMQPSCWLQTIHEQWKQIVVHAQHCKTNSFLHIQFFSKTLMHKKRFATINNNKAASNSYNSKKLLYDFFTLKTKYPSHILDT
jgi:hypothetical protein